MFKDKLDGFIKIREFKKNIIKILSQEFNVSSTEVHKRVRSYYGKSMDEVLKPTKKEFIRCLLMSDTIDEFKFNIKLNNGLGGLYEEYLNVSTFSKAKISVQEYREVIKYNPSRDDNLSLIISQFIGDGYLNLDRRAIDIQHGIKQLDYLILKANLFNKGFPTTNPSGNIKKYKHKDGHDYCRWWSGRIDSALYDKVISKPKRELIKMMTPLGMYLLYMDDGCLKNYDNMTHITIAIKDEDIKVNFKELLKTYGIVSSIYTDVIAITSAIEVLKFLNCFILPFKHLTPKCMEYKQDLMI